MHGSHAASRHDLHLAAVVVGEGEGGLEGEVGGELSVVEAHGEGVGVADVAVDGGTVGPVDKVVGRIRRGDNFHLGAGQDAVGVVTNGYHAGGQGGYEGDFDGPVVGVPARVGVSYRDCGRALEGGVDGEFRVVVAAQCGARSDGVGAGDGGYGVLIAMDTGPAVELADDVVEFAGRAVFALVGLRQGDVLFDDGVAVGGELDGVAVAAATAGALHLHGAPVAVVAGEGEQGVGDEVGADGAVGGDGDGVVVHQQVGDCGAVAPAVHVVAVFGSGRGSHHGAVVYEVGAVGDIDQMGGGAGVAVAVDLNLGYAKLVKVGAVYVSMTTLQCCLEGGFLVEGRVHGQSLVVELDAGDGVVFAGGGDGKGYLIGVTIVPSPEVVVVIHAAAEGNGGDVVEGAAAALEGVVGLGAVDGGQQGLFRSACAKRQAAPLAVVAGEGEQGVLGEGGGEGEVVGDGEGLAGGGEAVDLGGVAPAADVVAVGGGGVDGHRGAGQDEVVAVTSVGHAFGRGGCALNARAEDAFVDHPGFIIIKVLVFNRFASTVGLADGDDGVVAIFRDAQRSLVYSFHPLEAFVEEDRGLEGEGDVGVGVAALDGDVVGRRAGGHAVEGHGAPLAVVAGEGEDGDFVEGGGEGGRGGGHGVGVAAAEAGVALDGLGLVAPLGEVAALPGRGGDAQLGAGQDAVGVLSLGGRYAVGVHRDDAVLAGDVPIVDILR